MEINIWWGEQSAAPRLSTETWGKLAPKPLVSLPTTYGRQSHTFFLLAQLYVSEERLEMMARQHVGTRR